MTIDKKIKILTCIMSCNFLTAFCQNERIDSLKDDSTHIILETLPEYLNGGEQGMMKLFSDSIHYPIAAFKDRVGGIVIVKFTIDTIGNVTDIRIAQGIRDDIDKEAMRVVTLLNGWKPATQGGRKVKVAYEMPIKFFPDQKFERNYYKQLAKDKQK